MAFLIFFETLWLPLAVIWPFVEFTNWDITAWFFVFWANMGVVGAYGLYFTVAFFFIMVWWLGDVSSMPYFVWVGGVFVLATLDTIFYVEFLEEINLWYEGKRDTYRWDSFESDEEEEEESLLLDF